jgi:hypothetical protein
MFYKFVGAAGDAVLNVFDKAVEQGSIKWSSATAFNDPFAFKFTFVAPTRDIATHGTGSACQT